MFCDRPELILGIVDSRLGFRFATKWLRRNVYDGTKCAAQSLANNNNTHLHIFIVAGSNLTNNNGDEHEQFKKIRAAPSHACVLYHIFACWSIYLAPFRCLDSCGGYITSYVFATVDCIITSRGLSSPNNVHFLT